MGVIYRQRNLHTEEMIRQLFVIYLIGVIFWKVSKLDIGKWEYGRLSLAGIFYKDPFMYYSCNKLRKGMNIEMFARIYKRD